MLGLGRGRQVETGRPVPTPRSRSRPLPTAARASPHAKRRRNGGRAIPPAAAGWGRERAQQRPPAVAAPGAGRPTAWLGGWRHVTPVEHPPRQRRAGVLLHVALLSAVCLAGVLVGRGGGGPGGTARVSAGPAAFSSPSSRSAIVSAAAAATTLVAGIPAPGSVRLSVIAPLQQQSPFGASWREVLEHTAQRLAWTDPAFHLLLHDSAPLASAADDSQATLLADLKSSQAAVAIGVADEAAAAALASLLAAVPTAVALGSAQALQRAARLDGRALSSGGDAAGVAGLLRRLFPDKQAAADEQVAHTVAELYQRTSSDDFLFIFLVRPPAAAAGQGWKGCGWLCGHAGLCSGGTCAGRVCSMAVCGLDRQPLSPSAAMCVPLYRRYWPTRTSRRCRRWP